MLRERDVKPRQWSMTIKAVVIIICLVLIALVAYEIQPLITPLVLAGLLAYTLNLAVRFLTRRTPLSRKWAVNLVYFLLVAIIIATPSTLVPVAVSQWQTLSAQLQSAGQQLQEFIDEPVVLAGQEFPLDQLFDDLTAMTTDFGRAFESALVVVETTSLNLIRLVIIIVVGYYLLMDWHGLKSWTLGILPEAERDDASRLLNRIDLVWRAYLQGTLALMLIMAVVFIRARDRSARRGGHRHRHRYPEHGPRDRAVDRGSHRRTHRLFRRLQSFAYLQLLVRGAGGWHLPGHHPGEINLGSAAGHETIHAYEHWTGLLGYYRGGDATRYSGGPHCVAHIGHHWSCRSLRQGPTLKPGTMARGSSNDSRGRV